jgi:hypothetical protein
MLVLCVHMSPCDRDRQQVGDWSYDTDSIMTQPALVTRW